MIAEQYIQSIKANMLPEYPKVDVYESFGRVFVQAKLGDRYAQWSDDYMRFIDIMVNAGSEYLCEELKCQFKEYFDNPFIVKSFILPDYLKKKNHYPKVQHLPDPKTELRIIGRKG